MSVQIKKSSKLKDSLNWMGEMVREVWERERERKSTNSTRTNGRVKHASFSRNSMQIEIKCAQNEWYLINLINYCFKNKMYIYV